MVTVFLTFWQATALSVFVTFGLVKDVSSRPFSVLIALPDPDM